MNPTFRSNLYTATQSNSRFYVHSNVYLPNSEIDFQTGMVRESKRRTGRTQALLHEDAQLNKEYARLQALVQARAAENGMRMSLKAAVILILTVIFLFAIILLVQQGNIIAKRNTLDQMDADILATQEVIRGISSQIEEASDEVTICYAASQELDMIPAESAQAIYLSALSTRTSMDPIAIRAGSD